MRRSFPDNQHRAHGAPDHALRRRAQEQFAQEVPTVRADHDQVRETRASFLHDHRQRISHASANLPGWRRRVRALVELPTEFLLRALAQRLRHLFGRLRKAIPGAREYYEFADLLDDMESGERCPVLRCDLPGARDREIGSRREIGGDQHLTEGTQCRSCHAAIATTDAAASARYIERARASFRGAADRRCSAWRSDRPRGA